MTLTLQLPNSNSEIARYTLRNSAPAKLPTGTLPFSRIV